ncbi:MAG TPA: hypothetical protein VJN39_01355, partial [Gemmatimonadales bacterium]|nr:hypothetical protein [Gemmatimonadales bacterium]
MRALTVLVALVAMPLVAGVAQERDHQKWSTGQRRGWHGSDVPPGHAVKTAANTNQKCKATDGDNEGDRDEDSDRDGSKRPACGDPQPPPPPPPPPP